MMLIFFVALIASKTKICICHNKCTPLCNQTTFNGTFNPQFNTFLQTYIKKDKDIELIFYSDEIDSNFDLELLPFKGLNLSISTLFDSYPVKISFIIDESSTKQIIVNPNKQLVFHQIDPIQNKDQILQYLNSPDLLSTNHIKDFNNDNYSKIKSKFNSNQILFKNKSKLIKEQPNKTVLDNSDGLINVSCFNFEYSTGWSIGFNDDANQGSYSITSEAEAWFKFNGTRVHVNINREQKSAYLEVYLDDILVLPSANYRSPNTNNFNDIIFTSNYLPFGEHLIKIKAKSGNVVITSFFIDPLPNYGGYKLGFNDFIQLSGKWTSIFDKRLVFSSNDDGASGIFKFYGTRFWITGIQDCNHGAFQIVIDDKEPINVYANYSSNEPGACTKSADSGPNLLYQSNVLDLTNHTVKIQKTTQEVSLVNFLYTTQPYNAIVIPAKEMKLQGSWEKNSIGYSTIKDGSTAEITEYFNKFWVLGFKEKNNALVSIYYDDVLKDSFDTYQINEELFGNVLLYQSEEKYHNNYKVKIENSGFASELSNEKSLHINYCYYLNEKTIKIEGSTDTIGANDMNDRSGTWKIENNKLCSETKGSTVTFQITYSQFWIKGSIDPNYGNIEIIIDNQKHIFVSLYHEKHEDNIVYYESPRYSYNKIHTIVIINHDDLPINIQEIQYRELCNYERTTYNNLDGLINITCDKLILEGSNWQRCQNARWGEPGTYTDIAGKASYKFNGTRIHILSRLEGDKRTNITIRIDNKDVANLEYLHTGATIYKVIYSSDYLPFGEHSIEVEHIWKEGESKRNFFIRSFFIDPLPKVGGYKIQYDDIDDKSNNWNNVNEADTPYYYTTEPTAHLTYKFHGTRFWLTGIRKLNFKTFKLIIDEGTPINIDITINEKNIPGLNVSYSLRFHENVGYLLYESDVLELKDHTVRIENVESNEIYINNFLYSTQPYNAICIPSNEIQFDEHWIKSDEGYSSSIEGAIAETTNYFNHFWIIGNKEQNHANMNIYYNNDKQLNINPNELETTLSNHILLYELEDIPLDNYHFRIERINDNTNNAEQILHINYCYYLNDDIISINQKVSTIESSRIHNREGTWVTYNNNDNSQSIYSKDVNSSIKVNYLGSKFWIIGSTGPNYGLIDINIDGRDLGRVSLYQERDQNNTIYYVSPNDVFYGQHTITIYNRQNKSINIEKICYDSFVPTFIFSESQHFSISDYFSNSKHFSKSNDFTYTTDFTKSNDFTYTTNFTKSNDFTRTNDFTKSNYFTKSNDFTKTSGFTKTDGFTQSTYFTKSSDFSQSTDFTKSSDFIKTSEFTKSNEFTKTDGFKETSHFTKTADFTKTSGFSQSTYFTKSNDFSQSLTYSDIFTHHFSKSSDFTKSKSFESTLFFTKSNEFSESFTFSMSPTLEIKEPKCILFEDGEEKHLNECSFSISESKNVLIKVILTNFTHINEDIINGTAIHIENCGLDCNRTLFDDCTTSEGCGGAIYIRNTFDIYHNITFEDLIFINCKAICGGAVFIHSEIERGILFKNCTFISNEATNKKIKYLQSFWRKCHLFIYS